MNFIKNDIENLKDRFWIFAILGILISIMILIVRFVPNLWR